MKLGPDGFPKENCIMVEIHQKANVMCNAVFSYIFKYKEKQRIGAELVKSRRGAVQQ